MNLPQQMDSYGCDLDGNPIQQMDHDCHEFQVDSQAAYGL